MSEPGRRRASTATSNFGVGRREGHDSAGFYRRFTPPVMSKDDTVLPPTPVPDPFLVGNSADMHQLADGSVALVVTSPPYFAGKQYEEELEREGVPASYGEYLDMLHSVFAECARVLEPGGRIAVNVANLGRKPYRSLAADVITILQDDLGLLLRGEVVWQKSEGANGSCAWGSYRSAANPVLRDITERVVIASKGRFDRARSVKQRRADGLPNESTILTEDFLALTLDVWSIPPESAKRVGHPAPFPVELPEQLIRLYTFADDLVLDPFMGSGSTLVAAARLGRRYVGYDLDPAYVEIARGRVRAAVDASAADATDGDARSDGDGHGGSAEKIALRALADAGFEVVGTDRRVPRTGTVVSIVARDAQGADWWFDLAGPHVASRGGMQRVDVVWRALGRAATLQAAGTPLVLLTTSMPRPGTEAHHALRAGAPAACFDVVDLLDPAATARLAHYATHGVGPTALPGFW
mgnify:CR=1 FL=1